MSSELFKKSSFNSFFSSSRYNFRLLASGPSKTREPFLVTRSNPSYSSSCFWTRMRSISNVLALTKHCSQKPSMETPSPLNKSCFSKFALLSALSCGVRSKLSGSTYRFCWKATRRYPFWRSASIICGISRLICSISERTVLALTPRQEANSRPLIHSWRASKCNSCWCRCFIKNPSTLI